MTDAMDTTRHDCKFQRVWAADTPSEVIEAYGQMSTLYDKYAECSGYIGPMLVANLLAEFYPKQRRTVKVLDIGAGTGLVGVELQKLGFCTVDGLDPSQSMLEKAQASHVYTNLFCQYFTEKPTPGIDKDSYDVIISAGSLLQKHLPANCVIEAARIVRPGGLICMITRAEGTGNFNESGYGDQFKAVSKQLEKERKIEEVKLEEADYNASTNGILMVYRVLQ